MKPARQMVEEAFAKALQDLREGGTSEGSKKGWETRRKGRGMYGPKDSKSRRRWLSWQRMLGTKEGKDAMARVLSSPRGNRSQPSTAGWKQKNKS